MPPPAPPTSPPTTMPSLTTVSENDQNPSSLLGVAQNTVVAENSTLTQPDESAKDLSDKVNRHSEELTDRVDISRQSVSDAVQSNWSVTGEWLCPSYSYQQNNLCVSYVLHVPNVKETSVISHFDHNLVR